MKSLVIFVAFFAAALAAPKPLNLDDDLNDFVALLPLNEIISIFMDYLRNDAEVQEVVNFIQTSEEAKSLVYKIEAIGTYIDFLNFLEDTGLHVYDAINSLHSFMGLPPLTRPNGAKIRKHSGILPKPVVRRGTGINGLIDDIIAVLPQEELHNLFLYKEANSPDFQEMLRRIRSDEFQAMVKHLYEIPEFVGVLDRLREKGVDVDRYIELIRHIFGVER